MADAARTVRLAPAVLADSLFSVRAGFDREACETRLAEIAESGDEWIVAWDGARALGWVVLRYEGKRTHLEYPDLSDLFVNEEARDQGIGTLLIRHAGALAVAKGHAKIGLAVNPTANLQARELYERLGYVHDGRATYLDGIYDGAEDWVIDLERSF